LEYVEAEDGEDPVEWAVVKLYFSPHSQALASRIVDIRDRELATLQAGLDQMLSVVQNGGAVCRNLRALYGPETQLTCGGCPACRRRKRPIMRPPALIFGCSPATTPQVVVVANCPSPTLARHDLIRLIRVAVTEHGVRRFLCAPEALETILSVANDALRSDTRIAYRIDAYDINVPLYISPEDSLIVLHVSRPSLPAFELMAGRCITHWVCRPAMHLPDGRSVLDRGGIVPFLSPEAWLTNWRRN
jgi:hypothetical protein